jgi:cell division transport system permease protein
MIFGLSVSTMAAGLLLLGTYMLVLQNMRQVIDRFGHGLSMVAFLEPAAATEPAVREELSRRFQALEGVSAVRFVSREDALELLRSDLGQEASILEDLEANPLPASFEIDFDMQNRSPEAVRELAAALGEVAGVEEVRYGADWVEGYARVLRAVEWLGVTLGVFLIVILGTIVSGTVRLAVHSRADEIEIQRLVGAGALFVRLPFYLEGALQGTVAAVLALGLLFGLFQLGLPVVGDLLSFLLGRTSPVFLNLGEITFILLLGVGLGIGGAMVSLLRLEKTL